MHLLTIINITVSIALASLQSLAHAELNLTIPKEAMPADAVPTKAPQSGNTNPFDLDQKHQKNMPYGYQTTDKCPGGAQVTGLHYIDGKQYYKCDTDRAPRNTIPVVRDAERYHNAPSTCMPGSRMYPRCSNLPERPSQLPRPVPFHTRPFP